jgi:hypothetical protein
VLLSENGRVTVLKFETKESDEIVFDELRGQRESDEIGEQIGA